RSVILIRGGSEITVPTAGRDGSRVGCASPFSATASTTRGGSRSAVRARARSRSRSNWVRASTVGSARLCSTCGARGDTTRGGSGLDGGGGGDAGGGGDTGRSCARAVGV